MNIATRYVKIVEWSEEDECFVGSCPGLFYGGCHGDDEQAVFAELCRPGAKPAVKWKLMEAFFTQLDF